MLIRVDPASATPLYQQIRGALAAGELTPGERLPAARGLSDPEIHDLVRSYP
jgi:DNA-binding transcriptional regulator YhcF (GntR family)